MHRSKSFFSFLPLSSVSTTDLQTQVVTPTLCRSFTSSSPVLLGVQSLHIYHVFTSCPPCIHCQFTMCSQHTVWSPYVHCSPSVHFEVTHCLYMHSHWVHCPFTMYLYIHHVFTMCSRCIHNAFEHSPRVYCEYSICSLSAHMFHVFIMQSP